MAVVVPPTAALLHRGFFMRFNIGASGVHPAARNPWISRCEAMQGQGWPHLKDHTTASIIEQIF